MNVSSIHVERQARTPGDGTGPILPISNISMEIEINATQSVYTSPCESTVYDVVMLSFPPHCSHRLQPLDRTVFEPLKKFYNVALKDLLLNKPAHTIQISTTYRRW